MGSRHSTRLGFLSRESMNSAVVPRRYLCRCDFDIGPLFLLPFLDPPCRHLRRPPLLDRKSTRLNSSHVRISYAVFCLKKKITYQNFISNALNLCIDSE